MVVDLAPWGAGVATRHVQLETAHGRSGQFPWAVVGADAIQAVAHAAGLGRSTEHRYDDRWCAVAGGPAVKTLVRPRVPDEDDFTSGCAAPR